MRFIFAAFQIQYGKGLLSITKDVLETYVNHQKKPEKFEKQLQAVLDVGGTMFLDSGAFTAWTKGTEIDLRAYINFCLKFQERLTAIANLDVIPGSYGRYPTAEEVEQSARRGFENYLTMVDAGVDPSKLVHIFHQGESWEWLQKIVNTCPYFGISPANDKTTSQKITWLEQCMKHVCDKDGLPLGKYHGFGVTSWDIMQRYNWFSVDSSTWLRPGSFGNIYVPVHVHGVPDYGQPPNIVAVSTRSNSVGEQGKHLITMTAEEQELVIKFVTDMGFNIEELADDYIKRHYLNIAVTRRIISAIPEWPWAYKTVQPSFI